MERHVDDVHTYDPGASTCAQDTGQNVHGGPVRTGIKEERKKKKKNWSQQLEIVLKKLV